MSTMCTPRSATCSFTRFYCTFILYYFLFFENFIWFSPFFPLLSSHSLIWRQKFQIVNHQEPLTSAGRSPGKAAVMQICGDNNRCYVLHIFHTGIPQNLRNLLQDPTSVKVLPLFIQRFPDTFLAKMIFYFYLIHRVTIINLYRWG